MGNCSRQALHRPVLAARAPAGALRAVEVSAVVLVGLLVCPLLANDSHINGPGYFESPPVS